MNCPIYNKRAIQHNILRGQALSTPNDTEKKSISLSDDEVHEEEMIKVIDLLNKEECEIKGLEIVNGKIYKRLAYQLA